MSIKITPMIDIPLGEPNSDNSQHFENQKQQQQKLHIKWARLRKEVQVIDDKTTKMKNKISPTQKKTSKVILNSVSGEARPGEILAVMGPSGSGKTSLMSVLSGRSAYQDGTITVNNTVLDKAGMKRFMSKVAFVKQQDVFFETLTVRDQLTYTAQLRLPDAIDSSSKKERRRKIQNEVDRIIKMLRLTKVADNPIMMCSGGEKKRVNIGTELLTNPSVIMLDEPTSGLDSYSSISLLEVLNDLAKKHGKTIITTIHQPTSATFLNTFDKLLMVSDGNIVYFGTPADSLDYLKKMGYPCPTGYNGADFWMELLVSHTATDEEEVKTSPKFVLQNAWDDQAIAIKMGLKDSIASENNGMILHDDQSKYVTSWNTQFKTLTSRALKKNKATLFSPLNLIKTVLLGAVVGIVYFNLSYTEKDAYNVFSYFFLVMLTWIMLSMSMAVFTFPTERVIILKERATASYRLSAYFMAMTVADLPVTLTMPLIYMIVSYSLVAWSFGFTTFVCVTLIAMVGVMTGQACGYLIGATFNDLQIGQTVMMVVMSLLMLCGGFFNQNLPGWLSWVQYLSPFYYAGCAAMQVIFQEDIPCDGSGIFCEENQTAFPYHEYLHDVLHVTLPLWVNIFVLLLFVFVPRVFAYMVLRRKKPGERE